MTGPELVAVVAGVGLVVGLCLAAAAALVVLMFALSGSCTLGGVG